MGQTCMGTKITRWLEHVLSDPRLPVAGIRPERRTLISNVEEQEREAGTRSGREKQVA